MAESSSRTFNDLLNEAARDLPEEYVIEVGVEKGSGWVNLRQDGQSIEFPSQGRPNDETIAEEFLDAIAFAKQLRQPDGEVEGG